MQVHDNILRLRVLVGYLGERQQSNWWSSSFIDRTSDAFVAPIFGNAAANARIAGVTEAARRVHDDAIGVGRIFHLFRLPEALEQELHRTPAALDDLTRVGTIGAAIEELKALSSHESLPKSGPVHVGTLEMLADAHWLPVVAGHYRAAFDTGVQSFPYFAG
jgi:hypothetical protein